MVVDLLPDKVEEKQAPQPKESSHIVDLPTSINRCLDGKEEGQGSDSEERYASSIDDELASNIIMTRGTATHMIINSHGHPTSSKKTPISTPPSVPPIGGAEAKKLMVMFLERPGGTMVVMVATAFGMNIPAPMPVRARTATKESYVRQKALPKLEMAKSRVPMRMRRWWPKMAPRRPVMRTKAPCVSLGVCELSRVKSQGFKRGFAYEKEAAIQLAWPALTSRPRSLLSANPPAIVVKAEQNLIHNQPLSNFADH